MGADFSALSFLPELCLQFCAKKYQFPHLLETISYLDVTVKPAVSYYSCGWFTIMLIPNRLRKRLIIPDNPRIYAPRGRLPPSKCIYTPTNRRLKICIKQASRSSKYLQFPSLHGYFHGQTGKKTQP